MPTGPLVDSARWRRWAPSAALLAALALFTATTAQAVDFAATASVAPASQPLDDSTGTVFTVTVQNTGALAGIGAVEVERPSNVWTITACLAAPAGWTIQLADTKCRFRSADGTTGDIAPGESAQFQFRATTLPGTADLTGAFYVVVSRGNSFSSGDTMAAPADPPGGLTVTAHSFEVLDAVVAAAPVAAGSACPAPNKSALAGSTQTIVVCGRNRTTNPLTPTAALSTLGGAFIASPGTFSSGSISPGSTTRVLGSWSGAVITASPGAGKTVEAKIASAANRTSSLTTLGGYEALNNGPTAVPVDVTTAEETPVAIELSASDPDGGALTFAINTAPSDGSLGPIGAVSCSGGIPNTCTATVTYTPDADFSGEDSFTYVADDSANTSAPASVGITVTPVNDPPLAGDDSYGGVLGNTLATLGIAVIAEPVVVLTGALPVSNDADPDSGPTLVVQADTVTTTQGGTAVISAPDGAFTYLPPAGFTGTDSFAYTVADQLGATATGTISIEVEGPVIWYVDNSSAGGDGRSNDPLDALATLTGGGDVDEPGSIIFVYEGNTAYAGGLDLEEGQQLLGQPNGLSVSGHDLVAAGGQNPTITNAGGNGLGLANDVTVRSIDIASTSGAGIAGATVSNVDIANVTVSGSGGDGITAIGANAVTLADSVVSGNQGNGISLVMASDVSISDTRVLLNGDALGEHGLRLHDLTGTNSVSDTEVAGSAEDNIHVANNVAAAGTLDIGGAGCLIHDNSTSTGGHGVNVNALNAANLEISVDGCTLTGNRLIGIRADAGGTASLAIAVTGNTITAGSGQGNQGVDLSGSGSATVDFAINGNNIGTGGAPLATTSINVFASGGAGLSMNGSVDGNDVVNAGGSGIGIRLVQFGASSIAARVNGNTVSNVGLDFGILADAGGATALAPGAVYVAVTNNTVSVLGTALDAIRVQSRNANQVCAVVSGNTTNVGGAGFFGLFARQAGTSVFQLEGLTAGPQSAAAAIAFLAGANPTAASVGATGTFTGVAAGTCQAPN